MMGQLTRYLVSRHPRLVIDHLNHHFWIIYSNQVFRDYHWLNRSVGCRHFGRKHELASASNSIAAAGSNRSGKLYLPVPISNRIASLVWEVKVY